MQDPTATTLTEAAHLAEAGELDEAAALCRTALASDINNLPAMHLLGLVLLRAGNAAEAVPLLSCVADADGGPAVLHALAEALLALGLADEAEARWRQALALSSPPPEAWLALGNLLLARDDLAGAEHCFRSAIASRPDFVEAYNNLGNALVAQLRLAEALHCYSVAQALRPENPNTGFAYALALLLNGDFPAGWREFEARREAAPLRWNYQRRPNLPQWQPGESLAGKRVLLMAEQGAGDMIQFARYAPLLAGRGAQVLLELPRELHALFATLPGVRALLSLQDPDPACDIACPLLSLPHYFGTTLDTVPTGVPYAAVPPDRVAAMRAWLGPRRARRIGLVCSGRPEHPLDRHRSVPLSALAALLGTPGCAFVLVQQVVRQQDAATLNVHPALRWPGSLLRDFGDTAALLNELDLLISVDTSVAHLAGALARPVWLMLPYAPDFRWLLGRSDSPWYPTMRLYRQPAPGDWDAVIAALRHDLADG